MRVPAAPSRSQRDRSTRRDAVLSLLRAARWRTSGILPIAPADAFPGLAHWQGKPQQRGTAHSVLNNPQISHGGRASGQRYLPRPRTHPRRRRGPMRVPRRPKVRFKQRTFGPWPPLCSAILVEGSPTPYEEAEQAFEACKKEKCQLSFRSLGHRPDGPGHANGRAWVFSPSLLGDTPVRPLAR